MNAKVLLLILFLASCSSTRYLSQKEDEAVRKACETKGCVIVPTDLWKQVERLLGVLDET